MTEELNEKYIYKLSDNKYRIKFLKIEPGTNKRLYFNLNFEGTLEQAIKLRNEKLKGILNAINNWLYAVAKEYISIDQKELKTYVGGYEQRINRLIGLISKIMTCLQRVAFLCIQLEKSASISEVLVLVGKAVKCLMIKDELDYIENNIIAIDDENKLEQTYKSIESKIDDMTAFIDQKIQERQYKTEVK